MADGNCSPAGSPPIAWLPKPAAFAGEPVDIEAVIGGRPGGVPCLDRWNALIFASMLWGRPIPAPPCPDDDAEDMFGLRAFCSIPRGVDWTLMGAAPCGSEADRSAGREGTRGLLVLTKVGLRVGEEPSDSTESSDPGLEGTTPTTSWSSGARGA